MKRFLFLILLGASVVVALLKPSIRQSLVVKNSGSEAIETITIQVKGTDQGFKLDNIPPGGLRTWFPIEIDLGRTLVFRVQRAERGLIEGETVIPRQKVSVIASNESFVVEIFEGRVELKAGSDPDGKEIIEAFELHKVTAP